MTRNKQYRFFKKIWIITLLLWVMLLPACGEGAVFEENRSIEQGEWYYDNLLVFEVDIERTDVLYDVFVNVRHTEEFAYSNLWLEIKTIFPDGTETEGPLNLPMANEAGKWYGSGLGSTLSNEILIQENALFNQQGKYRFEISQNMRQNPSLNIMDVGMRIAEAKSTTQKQ